MGGRCGAGFSPLDKQGEKPRMFHTVKDDRLRPKYGLMFSLTRCRPFHIEICVSADMGYYTLTLPYSAAEGLEAVTSQEHRVHLEPRPWFLTSQ